MLFQWDHNKTKDYSSVSWTSKLWYEQLPILEDYSFNCNKWNICRSVICNCFYKSKITQLIKLSCLRFICGSSLVQHWMAEVSYICNTLKRFLSSGCICDSLYKKTAICNEGDRITEFCSCRPQYFLDCPPKTSIF